MSWSVPNSADGCSPSWIHDNYCDTALQIVTGMVVLMCFTSRSCGWMQHSWSQSQFSDDYCNSDMYLFINS